jgi:hypothetical protein
MAGLTRGKYTAKLLTLYPELFPPDMWKHVGDGLCLMQGENNTYAFVHICRPKKLRASLKRLAPLAENPPDYWSYGDYKAHVANSITLQTARTAYGRVEYDRALNRYLCYRCGYESSKKITMILAMREKIKI